VPPLRAPILRDVGGAGAFGRYGRMRLFLARAGGREVARLAAIVNPRLVGANGAPLGQIGYFDAVEGEPLDALFGAAFAWLRAAGCTEVVGPMNGGAHQSHRLLTRGFERPPFLLEPRNPPHHPLAFEAQGFRRVRRWRSYDAASTDLARILEVLRPMADAARARYRLEWGAPSDVARTIARIHPLLDMVWTGHTGYAHIDPDELHEALAGLLALMNERHLGFATDESGRDVGIGWLYPDWVDEVRALAGDASGWGAWLRDRSRPDGAVMHTIAVAPEVRRTGVAQLMMERHIAAACEDGHTRAVIALVDEDFRLFDKILPETREYALYGRLLA
jgi:GNAT superfamily N-acetyltransferase